MKKNAEDILNICGNIDSVKKKIIMAVDRIDPYHERVNMLN